MDVFFENQYKHTKEFYKEINAHFIFLHPLRIILTILWVVAVMVCAPTIIEKILFSVLVLVFLWTFALIRYFRAVKISYERTLEVNKGEPIEAKLMVTDSGIESCNADTGNLVNITFDKIKKVKKSKNYYLLVTKAKLLLAFKKDSFTVGSSEDFLPFLRSKGVKC